MRQRCNGNRSVAAIAGVHAPCAHPHSAAAATRSCTLVAASVDEGFAASPRACYTLASASQSRARAVCCGSWPQATRVWDVATSLILMHQHPGPRRPPSSSCNRGRMSMDGAQQPSPP